MSPEEAMGKAMERLRGAFALVALFSGRHDILMGARRGSSLAVGYGDGEMYIGTDALALAPFTKRVTYLEDDDWVVLNAEGATIFQGREEVKREIRQSGISGAMMGKGNHRHFMLKEIYEQPAVIGDTLQTYLDPDDALGQPAGAAVRLDQGELAAHHDGLRHGVLRLHGRQILVREAGAPAGRGRGRLGVPLSRAAAAGGRRVHRRLAVGRDRRYAGGAALRQGAQADDPVGGERAGKRHRPRIATSCCRRWPDRRSASPRPRPSPRSSPCCSPRRSPPAARAARCREAEEARLAHALIELPARVNEALNMEEQYRRIAEDILAEARDVLYLGRGSSFPIALEGALKLKEISYIHAEGYAARRDEARTDRADRRDRCRSWWWRRPTPCSTRLPPTSSR